MEMKFEESKKKKKKKMKKTKEPAETRKLLLGSTGCDGVAAPPTSSYMESDLHSTDPTHPVPPSTHTHTHTHIKTGSSQVLINNY